MNSAFSLMIVAAALGAPIEVRYPAAVGIYHCDFEESTDDDFDGWPQGWQRRRGPGYPHYLEMHLSEEPSPVGRHAFRFNLNGGAAAAWSPVRPFDPGSEYVVEAFVKTHALEHDEACVVLRFLDDRQREVQSEFGPRIRGTSDWTKVRVGPAYCGDPSVKFVVVELYLGPTESRDLQGAASFDDVWLARVPRKQVRGSRPYNVFHLGEPIELSLTLTGLTTPPDRARLELFDREGRPAASDERPAAELAGGEFGAPSPHGATPPQRFTWKPDLRTPGFYHGRVTVIDRDGGTMHEDATSLAVVEPIERLYGANLTAEGEFGWSIPRAADVPTPGQLHRLLHESGVRRLKYPVWYDARSSQTAEAVRKFVEQMNVQGIGVVGTLTPTAKSRTSRYVPLESSAVQTFRKPRDEWFPTIEPVLLDLAFKVRGWQLGDDRDLGFLNLPGAAQRVAAVKKELDRIEQDAAVGTSWSWLQEPPTSDERAWRFLALTSSPELTAEELSAYLQTRPTSGIARWVSLSALSPADYAPDDRVRDLVERLLAAKTADADAVFFVEPFHRETGLFEPNGSPTDLYLPWRTIAALLDGTQPADPFTLPGGSDNQLFVGERGAVMLLSSTTPAVETVDLPGDVRFLDLWGRPITPREQGGRRVVDVGVLPILAVGVDADTVRWSAACALENPELREVFGGSQPAALNVTNTYSRPIQGKISLIPPDGWSIQPRTFDVSLAAGEKVRLPFDVAMPVTAESGAKMLRIEHELIGDEKRTFALYRQVQVGGRDVVLEVETRLVGDELEIERRLINNSNNNVSFRFDLFAPNQKRIRTPVMDLPPGVDTRIYRLPDGRSMMGKMLWIRAEEVNGRRVLSRRFKVGDDS